MSLRRDGVVGLILLAISLALLVQAFQLPRLPIVPVGPGFYPGIVLVFMAAMSALLVVQDIKKRPERAAAAPLPRRNYRLVLIAFAIVGAYIALLPLIGFRLASALFVAVLQATIDRPRTGRGWAAVLAVAIGTASIT